MGRCFSGLLSVEAVEAGTVDVRIQPMAEQHVVVDVRRIGLSLNSASMLMLRE